MPVVPLALAAAIATFAAAPAAPAAPAPSPAPPVGAALSPDVVRMLEAAARSGNQARTDAVVAVAKETNPERAAEIDAIVAAIATERARARTEQLRHAHLFDSWKGSGQLGGSIATGNSQARSLTAGLNLERKGIRWRHRVNVLLDLVNGDADTDQERILAGYQLDYQWSERFYTWGRVEYERNRQAGIKRRFAESVGIGWQILPPGSASWNLELGPGVRQTRYVDYAETRLAARGASRLAWTLADNVKFTNDSALFWENAASVTNTAALTSRISGALSARLSYSLDWEAEPPPGLRNLDTVSRLTFAYDF